MVLLLTLLACNSNEGGDLAQQPVSQVQRACAPGNGPAYALVIDGIACPAYGGYTAWIELYNEDKFPITAGTSFNFEQAGMGIGTYCGGMFPDSCAEATAGTVRFDSFEEGASATGHWSLDVEGGTVEGDFVAEWCDDADAC
jgi:hypothetical protein